MFPGTERPAMTERRPGQASTVSNREYIFEQKQERHPQATTSHHHMTPHSRGEKVEKKKPQNKTLNRCYYCQGRHKFWHARQHSDDHRVCWSKTGWGRGWRGVEEQSLTVQRKAVEDQMILYTLLWWPFSPSAIQYCIPAFDPSLKHTSVVTHTQTLQDGWPASGQMRQQKMHLLRKTRVSTRF